jgi:hypothetical protein
MRLILVASYLISLATPGLCQTSTRPAEPRLSEQIRIEAFQSHNRGDNYGIASFAISNGTDKPVNSIELTCWVDDDRGHATKVLVWPSPDAIPAHASQQFSNVNIGLIGDSRSACEVTGVQ